MFIKLNLPLSPLDKGKPLSSSCQSDFLLEIGSHVAQILYVAKDGLGLLILLSLPLEYEAFATMTVYVLLRWNPELCTSLASALPNAPQLQP